MAQYSKNKGTLLPTNQDIYEVVMIDPTVASYSNWNLQVARGKVTGVTGLSISGFNSSVDTTYRPLWHYGNQSYTYFSVAEQVRIWSDSASDTNVKIGRAHV